MAERNAITQDFLKSILEYDPDTGTFTWKPRPVRPEFSRTDKVWNAAWSGKVAGTLCHGYVKLCIGYGKQYNAHRLAWLYMTGEWPEHDIDHIDLDRSNNAFSNLREATRWQNILNKRRRSDNKSGHKGVSQHTQSGMWRARVSMNGKVVHCSLHKTKEAAAAAYEAAARELHGEFARTD